LLDEILAVVLDEDIGDERVGPLLREGVGLDRMSAARAARQERLPRDHGHSAMLDASVGYLRQFAPNVLATVRFAGGVVVCAGSYERSDSIGAVPLCPAPQARDPALHLGLVARDAGDRRLNADPVLGTLERACGSQSRRVGLRSDRRAGGDAEVAGLLTRSISGIGGAECLLVGELALFGESMTAGGFAEFGRHAGQSHVKVGSFVGSQQLE